MDLAEIGELIREKRKDLKIDQATLAALANVGIDRKSTRLNSIH